MIYSVLVGFYRHEKKGDEYHTRLVSKARYVVSSFDEAKEIEHWHEARHKGLASNMYVRTSIEVKIVGAWVMASRGELQHIRDRLDAALKDIPSEFSEMEFKMSAIARDIEDDCA